MLCWSARLPHGVDRKRQRVRFRAGTSSCKIVLSGRGDGQTQPDNRLAGRWLGTTLACELKPVFATKASSILGCPNKDIACKAWAEALFLYPVGAGGGQAVGFGVWHLEKECTLVRDSVGGSCGADRGPGEHHL